MRAEQDQLRDSSRTRVVGLLIHGDAAFCGLGVVAEGLQMSNVPGGISAASSFLEGLRIEAQLAPAQAIQLEARSMSW